MVQAYSSNPCEILGYTVGSQFGWPRKWPTVESDLLTKSSGIADVGCNYLKTRIALLQLQDEE